MKNIKSKLTLFLLLHALLFSPVATSSRKDEDWASYARNILSSSDPDVTEKSGESSWFSSGNEISEDVKEQGDGSWYLHAKEKYAEFGENAKEKVGKFAEYAGEKYTKFEDSCGSKTVAYGVAGAAVAVGAVVVGLPVLGFGSAGVAAGSVAASVQSAVAGGAGVGVFGAVQSAGAAGLSVTTKVVLAGVGGLLGAKKAQQDCVGSGEGECNKEE